MKTNKAIEGREGGEGGGEGDAMSFQFGGNSSTASSSSLSLNNDDDDDNNGDSNDDDNEAASNPKQKMSKNDKSTNTSDMEQPSSHIGVHNKKCHACQHQRHERRGGRVLFRVCALALLAVAVIAIALPTLTMKKTKGETFAIATSTTKNNTNDSDSDNALSNDSSLDDTTTTTTAKDGTQATIPTTASPPSDDENYDDDNDGMPLCMEVSYQLEHLQWTAEQVWNQQGTTLRTGLEMAALQLAQDFCATYATPQRKQRNLLATNATAYPATVTNIVELSTHFCPNPYCMVVSQRVCVLYQGQDVDGDLAAVQDGFRQALRHAITTGLLIDMVPPEHLP